MKWAIVGLNLVLTYIFTGGFLPETGPIVGVIYTIFSGLGVFYLRNNNRWLRFVNSQLKTADGKSHEAEEVEILISASFLALGMKIGTALGLAVAFSMIVVLAFCILLATGYIIEGRKSGMTISGAWYIAKLVVWLFNKINGIYEIIADQIVKLEFKALNIGIRNK